MIKSATDPTPRSSDLPRNLTAHKPRFRFSKPIASDGADIYRLVRDGGTLELNSAYAYLLAGSHFSETSAVARDGDMLCGFVWAYLLPQSPETLFIWQIGVAPDCRGAGLGHALLAELLSRPACGYVRYLEATVTPSNQASMALFKGVGRRLGAPVELSTGFDRALFPDPTHETEMVVRIGPLDQERSRR